MKATYRRGLGLYRHFQKSRTLASLPSPFRARLLSMYDGKPQIGSDGELHKLDGLTTIATDQGMWFYDLCCDLKPKTTLEIGLAYGYSALYFLAAIRENGFGHHTAIDPFAESQWHGIGGRHVLDLGMADRFRLVTAKSVPALVHLAVRGETFEVIFIDGDHRFDGAFVDFILAADLCPIGGHIILDDYLHAPSVRRVAAFIRLNRTDFLEVETALPNIAVFERISQDERDSQHYVEF